MDEMLVFKRGRRRVMIRERICHVAHVQGRGRSIASGNWIVRVRRVGRISQRCELARGGDICNIKPSHQRICPPQIWIQNRRHCAFSVLSEKTLTRCRVGLRLFGLGCRGYPFSFPLGCDDLVGSNVAHGVWFLQSAEREISLSRPLPKYWY